MSNLKYNPKIIISDDNTSISIDVCGEIHELPDKALQSIETSRLIEFNRQVASLSSEMGRLKKELTQQKEREQIRDEVKDEIIDKLLLRLRGGY